MFLHRLIGALDKEKVTYALVGGYAVALQGAVRGTVEADIAIRISKASFLAVERALKGLGLESRLPVTGEQVFDFREEYIQNRNLIAWSFYNPRKPIEVVDIPLTEDATKIRVDRIKLSDVVVRVASVEDLIRMKKVSARPQDLADIDALKRLRRK